MTLPLNPPHTPRAWRRYDRRPPVPERSIHIMVADTLRRCCNKTKWKWTHIPLGEYRDPKTAGLLERMGVNAGWPDFIFVAWTGHIYFLELKSEKAILSGPQRAFFAVMRQWQIECEVARGYDEAIAILGRWGVVPVSLK
jgi:hypothetical protein